MSGNEKEFEGHEVLFVSVVGFGTFGTWACMHGDTHTQVYVSYHIENADTNVVFDFFLIYLGKEI